MERDADPLWCRSCNYAPGDPRCCMTAPELPAARVRDVHPRKVFLRRYALCVAATWVLASVGVWLIGDAPPWIVAALPAPLWATLGAAYVEDHHRRRDV